MIFGSNPNATKRLRNSAEIAKKRVADSIEKYEKLNSELTSVRAEKKVLYSKLDEINVAVNSVVSKEWKLWWAIGLARGEVELAKTQLVGLQRHIGTTRRNNSSIPRESQRKSKTAAIDKRTVEIAKIQDEQSKLVSKIAKTLVKDEPTKVTFQTVKDANTIAHEAKDIAVRVKKIQETG